eukprot:TRINITY_DN106666_c0_g1_i1.p1 TRINITY_DN106666_c0_g1~~TRINITY_DN106666_c0_g1_i1.p1  ORF type:complete len:376 (-),score=40.79 TRINITY_DN106666_c0_g1_i1:8-1135(-)
MARAQHKCFSSIDDLPEDCFHSRHGRRDDNRDSFGDIMVQLAVSKFGSPGTPGSRRHNDAANDSTLLPAHLVAPPADARRQMRRGMHQKPFGCQRKVGGAFGWAESLPRKDLTPWEQERAVSPERSWGPSAMTCVEHGRPEGTTVTGSPQRSCLSPPGSGQPLARSSSWTYDRRPLLKETKVAFLDDGGEVLTPVRATGSRASPFSSTRRPRTEDDLQLLSPRSDLQTPHCRSASEQITEQALEDVRALQEETRRLQGALSRTQSKLYRAVMLARHAEGGCPSEHTCADLRGDGGGSRQSSPLLAHSGNGGGALRVTRRHRPSGGGPFAGKQSVMQRTSSATWNQNVSTAAQASYNYLGPHADGPPLPEIHPMWS